MRMIIALFVSSGLFGAALILFIISTNQLSDAAEHRAAVERLAVHMHDWLEAARRRGI